MKRFMGAAAALVLLGGVSACGLTGALKGALDGNWQAWIEDPANTDVRYARSRARRTASRPAPRHEPPPLALAESARERASVLTLDRAHLREASPEDARRLVALAAVCAGGGDRLPADVYGNAFVVEPAANLVNYANGLARSLRGLGVSLVLEPGRFLVAAYVINSQGEVLGDVIAQALDIESGARFVGLAIVTLPLVLQGRLAMTRAAFRVACAVALTRAESLTDPSFSAVSALISQP